MRRKRFRVPEERKRKRGRGREEVKAP